MSNNATPIEVTKGEDSSISQVFVQNDWTMTFPAEVRSPYNPESHKLVKCFAKLLGIVNPENVDAELARLYALSTGYDERSLEDMSSFDWSDYYKILDIDRGQVKTWIYSAIATWMRHYINLFKGEYVYAHLPESEMKKCVPDFGLTIELTPDATTAITEFMDDISKGNCSLDCPQKLSRIRYRLENLLTNIWLSSKREHALTHEQLDELFNSNEPGHCLNYHTGTVQNNRLDVRQVIDSFLSLIDATEKIDDAKTDMYLDVMYRLYNKQKLEIYSLIFRLLTKIKQPDNLLLMGYPKYVGHLPNSHSEWIKTLPSYRPEFVITLQSRKTFSYVKKKIMNVPSDDIVLEYLHWTNILQR